MKNIALIFIIGLFSLNVSAQEKQAKIEFKTETIDYGEIVKGSNGIRVFEFTNTGDAPLIISRVYSSCGCTIPKKPEAPIMPGEKGIIEVKYNTERLGPIRKTITVYSNAKQSIKAIKIKGLVVASNQG